MTPEQSAWASIQPHLARAGLDPHRVENVLSPGHPDVDYTHGVIELKALACWPVRPETYVRVETLTGEQVAFLCRRWRAGGRAFLLARVDRDWFLFDGDTARQVREGLTQSEWRAQSLWWGRVNAASVAQLASWLKMERPA